MGHDGHLDPKQRRADRGAEQAGIQLVVGVGDERDDRGDELGPGRLDVDRLATLRRDRDGTAVAAALDEVRSAARGTENVLVPLKKALALRATVGEVCDALREVWGTYQPTDAF